MKDALNKLNEINNQRIEIVKQLKTEFKAALKQVFVDNPTLEEITMYVSNHEFNDGDATRFYIGWEDMTITVDGEEIGYGDKHSLRNNIVKLFGDVEDWHEDIYGEEYGDLTITREEVLKN